MNDKIKKIQDNFTQDLLQTNDSHSLSQLKVKYLGKKGLTTQLLKILPTLSLAARKKYGPILNKLKQHQLTAIEEKLSSLSQNQIPPYIDLSIPTSPLPIGVLHPTTQVIREINNFFRYYGFSIGEGPELEDVEYNFRRLNLPEGHPATDLQDSLFIREPNLLLRTHTSSVEARLLEKHTPPFRLVVPGKCFRNETTNTTNSAFFFQYQGFVVEEGITIQHLKHILTKFHQFLFGEDVRLRFRYKYYPEVSPGMGVDMQCKFCHGQGCQICKHRGWIEVLGSGMIHYNTLLKSGIDPKKYTGFAFGMGLDRLVMSKFGLTDIRKLYQGELVYL